MSAPGGKAVAAAAAGGFAYYHAQVPTSQLYGKTICRNPAAGKAIALTYDDGPNPHWTPRLMEILARHDARATFFSIGKWAAREPGLLRELHAAGHAIGNHTYTHPTMYMKTASQIRDELRRCREAVEASGVTFSEVDGLSLMRPPFGRRRPGTLRTMREEGYQSVTWSITCWDWRDAASKESILKHALKSGKGDVILMHDGGQFSPTADRNASIHATEVTLEHFAAQGYRFITIPELVAAG
ncbi:MAG: polysaccharide deacetylase family protein [Solirubrobacterales bacterium]